VANVLDILRVEFVGSGVGGFRIHDGRSLCRGDGIFAQMPDRDNPRGQAPWGIVVFPGQNA
jgi:hypothetical protein